MYVTPSSAETAVPGSTIGKKKLESDLFIYKEDLYFFQVLF